MRLKHAILRGGVFLALGAVVNVGVAGLIALTVNPQHLPQHVQFLNKGPSPWTMHVDGGWGSLRLHVSQLMTDMMEFFEWTENDIGETVTPPLPIRIPSPDEDLYDGEALYDARGWPCLSFWCQIEPEHFRAQKVWGGVNLTPQPRGGGISSGPPAVRPALPLRPIWPGFLINTLFYAAILWLLYSAPFALRRAIRARRGLCVNCAYDLRGADHAACPECGAVLLKPAR